MTGDMVPVEAMSIIGMSSLRDRLTELVRRVRELRLDLNEYICLKYILLLNPGLCHTAFFCVKGLFALTIWYIMLCIIVNYSGVMSAAAELYESVKNVRFTDVEILKEM